MISAASSSPFRRSQHRVVRSIIWGVAIALFCGRLTPASATKEQTGQWSPQNAISFNVVHMALLPSGGPYHSRIVMWDYQDITSGAEFGWNEGADGCNGWPYGLVRLDTLWNPPAQIVFAGHAQLATSRGLLTVGGFDGLSYVGIPDALKLAGGSGVSPGNWSARADMQQARQCPTLTALRDGRMLVTGGLRYPHEWHFGGRVDGNPPTGGTGDSLYRFGSSTKRIWDAPIKPALTLNEGDRPSGREGHSTVSLRLSPLNTDQCQALFGGKDGTGHTDDNAVYLLRREDGGALDADYTYRWSKLGVNGSLPPARSDHVAIDLIDLGGGPDAMVIYGGLRHASGDTTTVLADFWKLSLNALNQWVWSTVGASGPSPGPRYGHAAVSNVDKMYVFGGSATPGAEPADNEVYEFNFSTGQWRVLPVAPGPRPDPRRDHSMVFIGSSLLVYGGYIDEQHSSSALWRLALGTTSVWSEIETVGPSPGPRADHSALSDGPGYDVPSQRMTIFGGERPRTSDPPVDNRAYSIRPFPGTGTATWVQEPAAPYRLSGHTAVLDPFDPAHARIPEIYNPDNNTWTSLTNSGWMPPSKQPFNFVREYVVQFLVPGSSIPGGGGRLLRVGQDPMTRYLDIPPSGLAGDWHEVAINAIGSDTLHAVTGVQYLPGKILVAGNGPEDDDPPPDRHARKLDATVIETAQWEDASQNLVERSSATLLVLPNGKVMNVGGNRPQIWNPANNSWTSPLADQGFDRGFRSTAILLPDGRVLTGGGFGGGSLDLRVFCPPYLFIGDNLAPRPTITSAPDTVVYGESFLIGKSATDAVVAVSLVRPGAETHGFDQNGRYVPITFETVNSTTLRAYAPVSGSAAPPGDYMLFILGGPEVPSIAKWVHVGKCPSIPFDTSPPPSVVDLYTDVVGPNEIWLAWSAPGDDVNPALGSYDLRISGAPILDDIAFSAATPVVPPDLPPPTPGPFGSGQSAAKLDLVACSPYYFAIRAKDGCNNWIGMGSLASWTMCGGGGGGFSAQHVRGETEPAAAVGESPGTREASESGSGARTPTTNDVRPASNTPVGSSGVLVVETIRTTAGGWQIRLRVLSEADGIGPGESGAIASQVGDGNGNWKTLGRHQPSTGQSPLGACALRDKGRLVFPAGYALDRVVPTVHGGSQDYILSSAEHSRLGSLRDNLMASGGSVDMALGDVLTLAYAPSAGLVAGASPWYLLVRTTTPTAEARALRRLAGEGMPQMFALHAARPNPAREATVIPFDLPRASAVRLEVFDLLGRRIRVLAAGDYAAGAHTVAWDGRQGDGSAARSGVYLYRMRAADFRAQRAMVLLSR